MADTSPAVVVAQPVVIVTEPRRAPVAVVATGPQGPSGRDGAPGGTTFQWDQTIALAVWTVPHNLQRFPSVTVVDHLGNRVEPDVTYIDDNIVQITHGRPEIGRAYFN
ncbi:hypothetical protein TUM18999_57310 [Pseudomonas tohonis]|uniref:Uncharacterized protein n=1 Tax=Pseudomonas tohonis TaxID=2725477 RepID=A0A6J4EAK3_9PSED|nr:hypothetical protein [Pseudomonas tohonis]BCG26445.1 hypothetical protein TUM18999_46360 [Pseudomonas tohonis]BCG27540.1 hypothetical protein TUM18999_57310 [Pseudomonas tohonis]GJN50859.1 hypothetical protein TUM20286_06110 [Pseudomonas tohonis]